MFRGISSELSIYPILDSILIEIYATMFRSNLKSRGRAPSRKSPSPSRSTSVDHHVRQQPVENQKLKNRLTNQQKYSRSPSPHNAEYGRRSPDRPEGSVTSEAFGYQFRKSSDSSTSQNSELGSEDNVQRSTEEMFDMYPGMLAYLISDSLRDMFEELRGRRAKKRNTVNMETLITMGVLQEGFKQWHELLSKAGTAKLPGITQDKPDPFKIGMTLTLIQLCAHLEQAEFYLYGRQ